MSEFTSKQWLSKIYNPYWSGMFNRIVYEKYNWTLDANELAEDARQLLAMSLHRLDESAGEKSLSKSYILVAFKRKLVDAYREIKGRPRPGVWLKKLGQIGERLFDMYCLEKFNLDVIIKTLKKDSEFAANNRVDKQKISKVLREMDQRKECPPLYDSLDNIMEIDPNVIPPDSQNRPETQAEQVQAELLRSLLYGSGDVSVSESLAKKIATALEQGRHDFQLEEDEHFVLRCYRDQMPSARVGEMLGGLSVRQVDYMRTKALEKLQGLFEQMGILESDFQVC